MLLGWIKKLSHAGLSHYRHWIISGGIAVLDQGLFSGSNFVLNVLLARWLPPDEYGAFSVAFAIYLFVSGFHNALLLEPVSILGTAKYSNTLKDYLGGQLLIHFSVTGLAGLLVVITGLILYVFHFAARSLSLFIIGMGTFLPLMLLIWLARRSCYIAGKPRLALTSSVLYSVVLFSGTVYSHNYIQSIHPLVWYFWMGIAGLVGSLIVYTNRTMVSFGDPKWRSWFHEQWIFGKWIVLAAFLNFAGTQIQLFMVAARLGLAEAGIFRALQNFILPMLQIVTAVSTLVLPSISFEFGRGDIYAMRSKATKVASALTIVSIIYLLILFIFARPMEHILYKGRFAEFAVLVSFIGFVPLLTAMETWFSLVIRSLQKPVYYALSTGTIAFAGVVFSPILIHLWSLQGALLSLIVVSLFSLAVNIWLYRKWFIPVLSMKAANR